MRAVATIVLGLALLTAPAAQASDFWDSVRTPGLLAFRRDLVRGHHALRSRHPERALARGDAASQRLPDRPGGHHLRGLALVALGRDADAAAAFARALACDPTALDTDGAELAALAAARAGDHALAARILERLLGRLSPSRTRAGLYVLQADVLQTLGAEHLAAAVRSYRQALRDGLPDELGAKLGLMLALERGDRPAEARSVAETVVLDERRAWGLSELRHLPVHERAARLGLLLWLRGDLVGARHAWRAVAAERGPYQDHARRCLERLAAAAGPFEAGGAR
jgi:tetratricopeptide (TPR) repeat protein